MKRLYLFFTFISLLLVPLWVSSQTPTVQDCLGAIPICQSTYWTATSYSGDGNYHEEIGPYSGSASTNGCPTNCLSTSEENDVWYIFTVQTSGNVNFTIIPNNSGDDYDWAVYNLTTDNCSSLSNLSANPGLQVSCNYCLNTGPTGPNGGSTSDCEGPNGCTQFNNVIPVTAGETYVINVSNFSASQSGYNINFTASTASIVDNVPPYIISISSPVCGATTITVVFSENVMCNTVSAGDFTITGPGGLTVTSVSGAACAVGAPMENTFTLTLSGALQAGTYVLCLTGSAGHVADVCGNLSNPLDPNNCRTINIPGSTVSVTPSTPTICAGQSVGLTASGASTFSWSPATGLSSTTGASVTASPTTTITYTVSGNTGACNNGTATATVTVNPSPTVSITSVPNPPTVCDGASVTITANSSASGSTYLWNTGQTTQTISGVPTASTNLCVTATAAGCTGSACVNVVVNNNPTVTATASPSTICSSQCTNLTATGASSYTWMPGNLSGTTVNVCPTSTTTYTVTGNTSGCTGSATVTVTVNTTVPVTASAAQPSLCSGDCTNLTATGASTYVWMPGNLNGSTVNVCPTTTTTYTVTGNDNGCTGSATVTVNVSPTPVVTVSASPPAICTGQNSTLTASGANTYVWQPGGATGPSLVASPSSTTTYTVTGTVGSCTSSAQITLTVNPSPVITITPSNPQICSGQSVQLNTNSTVTLASCTWSPSTFLNPPGSCNPTASPTTTTTYNVMGQTAQGCSGTASVTVVVNPNPVVSISSNAPGNTICSGNCTQLTATSNPAASTWSWSPGTGLSQTNIFNPNACPTATTTYTATSSTAAGCSGQNTITITVNPLPVLTATPSSGDICFGGSIPLSVSGNPALSSCTWTPSASLNPPTGSCSPIASPSSTTTYTVTGQSAAGCTSTISVTVNVHPNPQVSVSPPSDTICFGESTSLTASDNPAGSVTTWNWSPATGLSDAAVANPVASPASTTTYTVTGTSAFNCSGDTTVTIYVNPLPVITFGALPSICVSSPVLTLNQASPSGGTYSGTGVNAGIFDPAVAGVGTHTILYVYTDPLTGCTDSASQNITVGAGIIVSVTPTSIYLCTYENATLTASGADTYHWAPPLGLSTVSGPVTVAHPPSSTIYTVTGTNLDGCSGSATAAVNYFNETSVTLNAEPNNGCSPLTTLFTFTPQQLIADSTWHWDFGDPVSPFNTSDSMNPTHTYQYAGNYIVTFSADDVNGCDVSSTMLVNAFVKPNADFYHTPEIGITDDPTITFVDLSTGANYWYWDFGDPNSHNYNYSDEQNPIHVFSDSGTFSVMLVVMSSNNCSDTAIHDVVIYSEYLIWIPNAFTPNEDRKNDVFKPIITGIDISSYKFYIFDRWGGQMFFTKDLNEGWNGTTNGKKCETGVYTYIVYFNEITGKLHKLKGIVTLYR